MGMYCLHQGSDSLLHDHGEDSTGCFHAYSTNLLYLHKLVIDHCENIAQTYYFL